MEKFVKIELIKLITELEKIKDKEELYDTSKYLISTIKSLKLFMIYYSGSRNLRLDLLSKIQKVFDGNLCVEELLDSYSINSKIDKSLIKHLTR